jgi:hypothetical protein
MVMEVPVADDAADILREAGVPLRLGSGRRPKPVQCEYVRDLTTEDLLKASTVPAEGTPSIKSLRASHHLLARTMATGIDLAEVSIITGYSVSRISILKGDPSFRELLAYYEAMEAEQAKTARADMHERLAQVGFDSLEVLHERLLDEPESFDNKTLLAVVEATADRTGHGKTATVNHEHSHSLSEESLARIRNATFQNRPLAEADRSALIGMAARGASAAHTGAEEADWIEGEGSCVREEGHQGTEEPLLAQAYPLPQVGPVS